MEEIERTGFEADTFTVADLEALLPDYPATMRVMCRDSRGSLYAASVIAVHHQGETVLEIR